MQVVEWDPKRHDECWRITNSLYFEDGGQRIRQILEEGGEHMLPLTKWLLEENDMRQLSVQEVWEVRCLPFCAKCLLTG